MKTVLPLIAALFLSSGLAMAAADAKKADAAAPAAEKKLTSSQQRMVDCNKEATGKKGPERKAFMSQCLKKGGAPVAAAAPAAAAPAAAAAAAPAAPAAVPAAAAPAGDGKKPQQNKMKDCNKQAGEKALKGPDRKSFMSECLKKDAAPAAAAAPAAPAAAPAAAAAPAGDGKKPQQNKMKDCNKQAGEKALKGPDRKAFMSECLKAK